MLRVNSVPVTSFSTQGLRKPFFSTSTLNTTYIPIDPNILGNDHILTNKEEV